LARARTGRAHEIIERGEAAIRHRGKERNDGNSAFARERTSMLQPNTGTARGIWTGINLRDPCENHLAKDAHASLV
jgi:hypothetical protein